MNTEEEAEQLIERACELVFVRSTGTTGYVARELEKEQTLGNLYAFGRRLHNEYLKMKAENPQSGDDLMAGKKVGVHGTDAERETGFKESFKDAPGKKSTPFPMTKAEFLKSAQPLVIKIGELGTLVLPPKSFNPDKDGKFSVGFGSSAEKITLMIGGKPVKFQVGINIIGINSKDADKE